MKKIFATVLALTMALSLAACGAKEQAPAASAPAASAPAASAPAAPAEEATGLKIAIITSSGVDDGSFNQNCYKGILDFVADHPDCTVQDIKENDLNELVPTVDRLAGDYDVFVLPGFNFTAIGDIAMNNPDKYFLVVDSTITDSQGNAVTLDNVYTMTFTEEQGGFFAGMAAAFTTKTNKVAVMNAMAYPSNVNYQYGFMSGVNYANKYYGTSAEYVELPSYAGVDLTGTNVGGNYTGDFADEATGKVVGEALIAEGCDVIFTAAGASANGTWTAIKETPDVMVIACDVDQYDDGNAGDRNIVLTSTLKVMDINVTRQLNEIYNGTFVGQDALLGADTDSSSYVATEGRQQLSAEALAAMAECYELVKNGTIVPAANFNGHTPTNFPGL